MNRQKIISAVVPVFNSEAILPELAHRLQQALGSVCGQEYEIILVDDCSTDGAWKKIKELACGSASIKGIRLGKNAGQWMAALAGIKYTTGKYIVTIDDDLEYDPADIAKLYQTIRSGDLYLVFGIAPEKYRKRNVNELTSLLRNRFINLVWHKFLTDSFKIFRRELLFSGEHFAPKVHFEAFIKHTLSERFAGYAAVSYSKRFAGKSNHTLWRKAAIFLRYSIEYYRTPAIGTGLLAFVFIGLACLTDYFIFKRSFLSELFIGLALLMIAILVFHYTSVIYRTVRGIPDYWIIETAENVHADG